MTMRRIFAVLLPFLFIACLVGCTRYDYVVEDYRATVVMPPAGNDLAVELDITYRMGGTPKADGFKYVSPGSVRNLRCTDGAGNPLRCAVFQERETKIAWYFAPVHSGKQRVIVNFMLAGAVGIADKGEVISLPWAGVFRVPVEKARYEVVFTGSEEPRIVGTEPSDFCRERRADSWALVLDQRPLDEKKITITFGPEWGGRGAVSRRPEALRETGDGGGGIGSVPVAIGIVGIFVIFIVMVARTIRKGGSGSGGDASGSGGCGGSSCGGGGCGGGCGG